MVLLHTKAESIAMTPEIQSKLRLLVAQRQLGLARDIDLAKALNAWVDSLPPEAAGVVAFEGATVSGEQLDRMLALIGVGTIPTAEAVWLVACGLATDILDGSVTPYEGAREIWLRLSETVPELSERFSPFVAMASEWEDDPENRLAYEQDIRVAARRLLELSPAD